MPGAQPRRHSLKVDDAELAIRIWERDQAGPEVVLVHGGAANTHWWDHLVGTLADVRRVVAVDLSGHGESEHRSAYRIDQWAHELLAVADAVCTGAPLLVGHSMGGLVSVCAAQTAPERLGGVLALDSPLARDDAGNLERRRKIATRPVRSYATEDEALVGFRTTPPATEAPPELIRHVARHSVVRREHDWALRFDPLIYDRPQAPFSFLEPARVPTWWLRAEHGLIDDAMAAHIRDTLGPLGRLIWAPGATHHLVLDQARATSWIINAYLQTIGTPAPESP